MKIKNKLLIFLTILALIIPIQIQAYSNKVILGGENVGIEIESNGIIIVGFYQVNNKNINLNSNIKIGDKIIKVGNTEVDNIDDMVKEIDKSLKNNQVDLTLMRNKQEIKTKLQIEVDESGVYKTGLYVKDKITGIGTITYIDPSTSKYGALGHEIIESYSNTRIDIKDGKIFSSTITGINKSSSTKTGEKEATLNEDIIYGNIDENTESGIYGTYHGLYNEKNLIEVASVDEIQKGEAYIYTVLDGTKKEKFKINIINIDKTTKTKNILFEITDKTLINKTNGVIKGMSGSPIVQNGKIVGAVTHAIQTKNNMGYGIFITTMLEEGDN